MTEVSSTGAPGWGPRGDERVYWNYERPVTLSNIDQFMGDTGWHLASVEDGTAGEATTRAVMRAIVGLAALNHLLASPLADSIEAAAPLPTGEYMVYAAHNRAGRGEGLAAALRDRNRFRRAQNQPANLNRETNPARPAGDLRFVQHVPDPAQLHRLWETTFGWSLEGCQQFAARVDAQQNIKPLDRRVWFGGLTDGDQLVAAAMVERLDMPSAVGNVALLETTEWAALPEWRRHGLLPRLGAELTRIVQADMATVSHLVFGECNLRSGAPIAVERAGLAIPEVPGIRQILVDNVRVGDGFEPVGGYRSFLLMTAPQEMASQMAAQ